LRDRLSSNGSHCPPCQNRGRAPARPIRSGNQARSTHHARAWLGREESREGSLANEGKQPVQGALISRRRISLERGEMAGPSVLAERGTEKSTPSTTGSRWWWSTSCSISPGTGGIAYLHDRPPLYALTTLACQRFKLFSGSETALMGRPNVEGMEPPHGRRAIGGFRAPQNVRPRETCVRQVPCMTS